MGLSYADVREELVAVAALMWERRLTNAAGGNLAARVEENRILISPSLMSERKHCRLKPADFLLIDYGQNLLEGEGRLSRESLMHCLVLRHFPQIGCTIHAHPFHCMPFVAQSRPIPSVTEATMGRGEVGCIPWAKAYSRELSENVYRYFEERREVAERKPIGLIMPRHGVFVSGADIDLAYSMLERIETDAYCTIVAKQV